VYTRSAVFRLNAGSEPAEHGDIAAETRCLQNACSSSLPESPARTAWPLALGRLTPFQRVALHRVGRYEPLRLVFGHCSGATSGLRRLKRGESLVGTPGERNDRLALVALECLAQGGGGLVVAGGRLEHLGEVGERLALFKWGVAP
jgi:hypothetical protein